MRDDSARDCSGRRFSAVCGEMITFLETCVAEAAKARAEAERTNLPRVREQLLRSAEAWEAQAASERRFAHLRSRNELAKSHQG
jgi:hypothetical protein